MRKRAASTRIPPRETTASSLNASDEKSAGSFPGLSPRLDMPCSNQWIGERDIGARGRGVNSTAAHLRFRFAVAASASKGTSFAGAGPDLIRHRQDLIDNGQLD